MLYSCCPAMEKTIISPAPCQRLVVLCPPIPVLSGLQPSTWRMYLQYCKIQNPTRGNSKLKGGARSSQPLPCGPASRNTLSISRLTYRLNPSLSALHRSPWPQAGKAEGRPEQAKVKPVVRSFVRFVHPLSTTAYSTVQHRSETPLPLHSQSLILASAARRTPITSLPPLSLQITHHLPSHIFETSAVVISQVRYCPVATCPVEHQPLHPEQRRRRPGLGRLHEHCRCPVRGMASNC
jgi:hypothetical protein